MRRGDHMTTTTTTTIPPQWKQYSRGREVPTYLVMQCDSEIFRSVRSVPHDNSDDSGSSNSNSNGNSNNSDGDGPLLK